MLSDGQRVVPSVIAQAPSGLLEIRRFNGNTISARPALENGKAIHRVFGVLTSTVAGGGLVDYVMARL